jgi:hypothetical protein
VKKTPISKSEFESGKVLSDLEKAVIAFLERNRDKAFNVSDIMDGINIQTDFRDFWKAIASGIIVLGFPSILNNLVTSGKIRVNIIQGIYYYMAK